MGLFQNFPKTDTQVPAYKEYVAPSTRPRLFLCMLREHFWNLIPLNLLQLAFYLPAVVWTVFNGIRFYAYFFRAQPMSDAGVLALLQSYCLGLVPCLLLADMSAGGSALITRNWARDQRAEVWADFWHGIAANWSKSLRFSAITAALPLIYYGYLSFIVLNPAHFDVSGVPLLFTGIATLLWLGMKHVCALIMVTYRLSWKDVLRNGFLLAMRQLPRSLGLFLLRMLPLGVGITILLFFSAKGAAFYLLFYYCTIGFALDWLLKSSHANWLCEEYMNIHIDGASSRIGLRPKE